MKSERRGLSLFVVVLVLLVSAVLGGVYGPSVGAAASSADDYQTAVKQFTRVLDVVQSNYADPVDVDKEVYQGAIPGMLRVLDPHSNFFDARQFALLREDQRGRYYGVGMIVAPRENHTVVMAPYVGAPAYNAGLRPGDIIIKVDEKATDGLTTTEVADMLKGQKGTIVKIVVTHHGRSSQDHRYYAVRGNQGITVPLVILVNNNSASATEIVSGAVQDHDRGLVVGETTFGKGLVQTVQALSENTGLALTTARYYTPSGRLIQRDYKSISLYQYHYERKVPDHPTEIKLTDSGRQVTGGGGITPDIIVSEPKLNKFQQELFRFDVFYPAEAGVGGFTRAYLGERPTITHDFSVDDHVMHEFRNYLSKHNVRYAEAVLAEHHTWVKRKIKQEVFMSTFGMQDGFKVLLEADPQVQKAIDSVPQARALYQNARKIVAQRNGGALDQP